MLKLESKEWKVFTGSCILLKANPPSFGFPIVDVIITMSVKTVKNYIGTSLFTSPILISAISPFCYEAGLVIEACILFAASYLKPQPASSWH